MDSAVWCSRGQLNGRPRHPERSTRQLVAVTLLVASETGSEIIEATFKGPRLSAAVWRLSRVAMHYRLAFVCAELAAEKRTGRIARLV